MSVSESRILLKQLPIQAAVMHGSPKDPYRLFFPLGILLGIAGVSIWPLYYYGFTDTYSGRAHAFLQIEGFLYCFAVGFLLTAIPRFTGTAVPTLGVQYFLASLLAAGAVAFEFQFFTVGHTAFLLSHTIVLMLVACRFSHRQQNPPSSFPLVGAGLITGAVAALINVAVAWEWIAPSWDPLGKRLLTEGMFLMLVLGVGGFLGPRLLGFAAVPNSLSDIRSSRRTRMAYASAGLALFLSVVFEYGFGVAPMAAARAAIATAVVAATMWPWRFPATRTTVAWSVWLGNWFVILGVWSAVALPRYRVDFLHVLLIGGFTVLIVAVATRVVLSHGGLPLSEERRSWPLRITVAAGLLGMLSRIGAPFTAFAYFEHLAFAGVCWIGGMLIWGAYLISRLRAGRRTQE